MEVKNENKTVQAILNSSLNLLNKYGYGSLSLSSIAKEARTSKQNVYYYYKNTDDILIELATHWSDSGKDITLKALADTPYSQAYKVLAIAEGMFKWMELYPQLSKLALVLYQTGPHVKKLNQYMNQAQSAGRERIKYFLTSHKKFEALSKNELDNIALQIHTTMYGAFFYIASMRDYNNIPLHQENCLKTIKTTLDAYLK
ncbi:MAG: TetR/AcrR family transcriptional regulator [Pseudobdellovibrio sp.]